MKQPRLIAVKESGDMWELQEEYEFKIFPYKFTIPKGYTTDGASVPKWACILGFLPRGIHDPAWLIHDWMYDNQGEIYDNARIMRVFTRKQSDKYFLKNLKKCGVKSWRGWMAHRAVRIGGVTFWDD